MTRLMLHLDEVVKKHRRLIVSCWIIILAVSIPFAMRQSNHLTSGGYMVAGSQSAKVAAVLKQEFPAASRASLAIFLLPRAKATSGAMQADITRVEHALHGISGVELTKQARELALFTVGLVGPIVMPLQVKATEDQARDIARTLGSRLGIERSTSNGVEMYLLGQGALWAGVEDTSKRQVAGAEKIGFPILLLVLLMICGSLSVAALPVALGLVAVVVTGALIYFLSLAMQLSIFITDTASMLGIGVAVDYSLIVLARVRQELQAGQDIASARKIALSTSGRAVAFSGMTVIVSLAGLWVIPVGTLRSMALGAMIVIAVSVLTSVTLLPTLISLLGARRIGAESFLGHSVTHRLRHKAGGNRLSWDTWTRTVTRHPLVSVTIAGGVLLVFCIPALSMKTSTGALAQLSPKDKTRIGFTEATKVAGPGALGPIYVVVHPSRPTSRSELGTSIANLRAFVGHFSDIKSVGPTELSSSNSYGIFSITPSVGPESSGAMQLVQRLRSALPLTLSGTEMTVELGGASATQLDEEREVANNMWKVFVAVLTLAFCVLMVLLRSILLPLKAIAMNLLSVGAAYGVLVVVFQWGWFDAILNYHSPGHIDTLTPPLVLAIIFGLSMDYEVFLLSRIKERWSVSGDSRRAVAEGLAASAKTISSAAFILVCAFAVFIGTGEPPVKELGLGAAVAIGIDATLIRLVAVPATVQLLGDWNWWWPRQLNRLIPAGRTTVHPDPNPALNAVTGESP